LSQHLAWVYIRTCQQPKLFLPATNFSQAFWLGTWILPFASAQDLARKSWKNFLAGSKFRGPYFVWTSGLNIYKHAMPHPFQAASSVAKDFDRVHSCSAPESGAHQKFISAHPARH
jgi:hypothetical protein